MTEFLAFDLNTAYAEIKERGERQAVVDREGFNELVEDYIQEKLDLGELNPDEDTELFESQLKAMWPKYEENLRIR